MSCNTDREYSQKSEASVLKSLSSIRPLTLERNHHRALSCNGIGPEMSESYDDARAISPGPMPIITKSFMRFQEPGVNVTW